MSTIQEPQETLSDNSSNRVAGKWSLSPIGFGTMPISWEPMLQHRERALKTVHAALDAGVTLLDSANIYAPSWDRVGYGERLVREALETWDAASEQKEKIVVATKGGIVLSEQGGSRDASHEHLSQACSASLEALAVNKIDLYYLHWPASSPSFAKQVENMLRLQQDGLVEAVGLSNISAAQLAVALDVGGSVEDGGIVAIQNEFSPRYRENEDVIDMTAEHGIAYFPWSPFGGADRAHKMGSQYAAFSKIGDQHSVSAYQIALAWLLKRSPNIIPIPGATRPETILDSIASSKVKLSSAEFDLLSSTIAEGTSQYPSNQPAPPLR